MTTAAARKLPWVVRLVYPLRILGFFITLAVLASSLYDRSLSTLAWVLIAAQALSWPHLAYLHARHSRDPKAAELLNLVLDCTIAGFYTVFVSFSLLPSAFMLGSTLFDTLSIGGPSLALRGLIGAAGGALLGVLLFGVHLIVDTNLAGSLTSVGGLFVFIGFVSTYNYNANRSFRRAKRALEQKTGELQSLVEQLERATAQAEAANRAKSQFLANMSHELRTPMNAVIGFTDLLLRNDPTPRQQQQLQHIESASHSLLVLINQILDLSKIEAGKLELERHAFALPAMLDKLEALFHSQAAAKGLQLKVLRGEDLPESVTGDDLRLEQVLMNLVGNAIKFTEKGSIELRIDGTRADETQTLLKFAVRDSGIGIAAAQLARLFQPFTQADQSTTRKYGGTGLGLAISKQLVDLMGGQLIAESEPGKGSVFRFAVPVTTADFCSLAPDREHAHVALGTLDAAAAMRGKRVLLAEDNALNRRLAAEILEGAGIVLDFAEDGRQAVAAVRAKPYDVVLMDMQMPEMDGLEATRAIRALPGFESLPIIAITANAYDDDRAACVTAGMNDFLAKPINAEQMVNVLAKWATAPRGQ
jgi:signal transduction histidine kinase/ActR/RegA family two-component response regulator